MINSMTGFGRASARTENLAVNLEMKSLNNRYHDFHIKMPTQLNFLEEKLKQKIKLELARGRVEIYIKLEYLNSSKNNVAVNYTILEQYQNALQQMQANYGLDEKINSVELLRLPEVLSFVENELDQAELEELVMTALNEALVQLKAMRQREGVYLEKDISQYLLHLDGIIDKISTLAPKIVEQYYQNLKAKIAQLLVDYKNDDRLMLEVALLADKSDISEELKRLKAHSSEAKKYLSSDEAVGRKLDFLIQEMNREVNTIGSKSANFDIATDVIEMKSTLEKMREQVQNIE